MILTVIYVIVAMITFSEFLLAALLEEDRAVMHDRVVWVVIAMMSACWPVTHAVGIIVLLRRAWRSVAP